MFDAFGLPISKVYVKTFAQKKDDAVMFYKDGYTDLRGRFDYAAVHMSDSIKDIKKFSFFIMSEEHGSIIKEAVPPS